MSVISFCHFLPLCFNEKEKQTKQTANQLREMQTCPELIHFCNVIITTHITCKRVARLTQTKFKLQRLFTHSNAIQQYLPPKSWLLAPGMFKRSCSTPFTLFLRLVSVYRSFQLYFVPKIISTIPPFSAPFLQLIST